MAETMPIRPALLIVLVAAAAAGNMPGSSTAPEYPDVMVRMVVRVSGPGIKPKSFSALPKTIYRGGQHYARIEDAPDARQQMQKLTVIAEPDAYSVNLIDKKGTHYVDGGGNNDLHLPIVLPFDPKHQLGPLDRLEFGDEYDFFEDAAAKPEAGPIINGKPTDVLRLALPKATAQLVIRAGTHIPIKLTWTAPEGNYEYEYIEYVEKPFEASLFQRPDGITYKEIRSDTIGEH